MRHFPVTIKPVIVRSLRSLPGLVILFASLSLLRAQDDVLITEFMASNNHTLLDQDGDASDWIELYNTGTNTVNLNGWHLTDNASDLTEWTFPATNLAPNSFMIVFASGKNRAVAGQELHTDFSLSSSGEYLALVRPDGTVAQDFAPEFPPQLQDVSYGFAFNNATNSFVISGATAKWKIPHSAADFPVNWTATNFDDSSWSNGATGLGFSSTSTNFFGSGPATNVASGKVATQTSTFNNDTNTYGPLKAVDGNYTDFSHTYPTNIFATWEVNLATNYGIDHVVLFNRTGFLSRLRDITIRILSQDGTTTNYTSPLLNPTNILGNKTLGQGPTNLTLNLTQLTGGLVLGGRVRVTRTPDPLLIGSGGQGSNSESNILCLVEAEVWAVPSLGVSNAFGNLIQTDLHTMMTNVNATALIRLPFDISSGAAPPNFLTLQMKYNAGFVAYLNGVEVARRNAANPLAWNSAATNGQSDSAAVQFENIDISPAIGLLQSGQNILAVQGLNLSATNTEFLILPQLTGTTLNFTPGQYFSTPTPGAPNSGGALGTVAAPQFSVARGFYNAPFSLNITSATANAQIRFTTDGSLPSAVNGALYAEPITITNTAVIRAIATEPGYLPSDVITYTYVFLNSVLAQNFSAATNAGWPAAWTGTTPDYDMDPRITGAFSTNQMLAALQSLPSVFITATMSNLFDPATGIYVHPTLHGSAWECPAAVEMVDTNGQSEFETGCGLRIQGGAFRAFSYTQKKSFRILFTSDYGVGMLHYDLFNNPNDAQTFNTFVLRASGNDGYAWGAASNTVQFIRDEFGRRIFSDMGHVNTHGIFVHVYLNGLYWGLYNLAERPNQDFSASYFGDDADADWDSISGSAMNTQPLKNGDWTAWTTFSNMVGQVSTYAGYEQLQGLNPDGSRNSAWPVYYDKLDYMDYMIVNIWGGNWDWPANNFWLGYDKANPNLGWQFYMWDYEDDLGLTRSPIDYVAPKANTWVAYPYSVLKNLAEFKIDFADRVQKYFFNGGLLTPQVLTNRYSQLANSVQQGIICESARWGDDNINPPLTLTDWQNERDYLLTNYLQLRTAIVMLQLRTNGLYPGVGAPLFSQFGGNVPAGYNLSITQTNAGGVIYFTTDGSDPRLPGVGTVSATAQSYITPIVINSPTLVRSRVSGGGQWSALVEAIFQPPQDLSALELTEIMYDPPNVGSTNGDEFEFLEMKNVGTNTLNLSGLTFTAGINFTFTNGTLLGAGQFFVIARDAAAFHAKYPGVALNGIYTGKLDNGGEAVTLSQTNGATVFSVTYNNNAPWPVTPHGFGWSLVQKNPGTSQAPDEGAKWRASAAIGGSPGADDPSPTIPGIVVNEVLANSPVPLVDAIELYNPTAGDVDISDWFITDDSDTPQKYKIPNGTILPEGGYIIFDESQFNPTPGVGNSFAFSADGDSAYLFSADTNGNLTGYSHGFDFGASFAGVSFGRYVNSAGDEQFPLQISRTFGAPNSGPSVGPIVINEIQYHPPAGGDEFVELLNITSTNVPLFDPLRPTNTWKFSGVGYTFPTNITLGPAQMLLLVQTNPASFQAKYAVPTNVLILGPYPGALDNGGEDLQLQAPDAPAGTNAVPYVTIDEVDYNNKSPWPPAADGSGPSLQRWNALAYGNDPINWTADTQTPGAFYSYADSDGDSIPDWWMLQNFGHLTAQAGDFSRATDDPDGDGFNNLQEFLAGTNPHDAASYFGISNVSTVGGNIGLQFLAASNHTYSVIFKTNLTDAVWIKLADVAASPTNSIIIVTDPTINSATRFYRLVAPAQP